MQMLMILYKKISYLKKSPIKYRENIFLRLEQKFISQHKSDDS